MSQFRRMYIYLLFGIWFLQAKLFKSNQLRNIKIKIFIVKTDGE